MSLLNPYRFKGGAPVDDDKVNYRALVTTMLGEQWPFIQRSTGTQAATAGIPELVTAEGMVKNNQFVGGALGGYTPDGTASSEGIALMLRGVLRAAIATNDPQKIAYAKFLFDGACNIFFKGVRPTAVPAGDDWNHSWIANAGEAFKVRGPLQPGGDLALSGYLYTRDPESTVVFAFGLGMLTVPPDIIYQVVTAGSTFVWENMYADLLTGSRVDVEFYIDSAGNKVFGTQRGGSFGQPAIPAGQHSDGEPGTIKLKSPLNGTFGVNFSTTVPDVSVAHAELYEAWPMWRKLAAEEVSTAADAIHWFLDAFHLGTQIEPGNADWSAAHAEMLKVWTLTCAQESNTTRMFQAGANGPYNNFPLTYGYAYGRTNVDDPASNWDAKPPTAKYTATRGSDGMVTFVMPAENGAVGSGQSVRYGVAFQNSPLFLEYTPVSSIAIDAKLSVAGTMNVAITSDSGQSFEATVLVKPDSAQQSIGIGQFLQFQQTPGDATGDQTGDWSDEPEAPDDFVPPVYSAVPFPGRRLGVVGDSISWMNNFWNPAIGDPSPWDDFTSGSPIPGGGWGGTSPVDGQVGYYEYFGNGMCGYIQYANQILGDRLSIEPAIEDRRDQEEAAGVPATRYRNGTNFAVAGSRTVNWHLGQDDTLGNGILEVGPMFAARRYMNRFDTVVMLGGTNDLAGDISAQVVFENLRKFAYEFAAAGKWVFLLTIMPRTNEWLGGWYSPAGGGWFNPDPATVDPAAAYSLAKQEQVRQRLLLANQKLRDWFTNNPAPNIYLVDAYAALIGPNGKDPAGWVSSTTDPLAKAAYGNYKPGYEGITTMYDGLHPGPMGAYLTGKALADAMIAAGVPARTVAPALPYSVGPNLLANPTFARTSTRPANEAGLSNIPGRAIGLGRSVADASHPYWTGSGTMPSTYNYRSNLGLGYEHGNVPDYWQFYRSQNHWTNPNEAEGFANFNEYTYSALVDAYPSLADYMVDSTWADGCVKITYVTLNGAPAMRIAVNFPQSGNKNESFIIRTMVPAGQHGAWDNYGYAVFDYSAWFQNHTVGPTQDDINTVINTLYQPGDFLYGKADVTLQSIVNMFTWRMSLNFLAVDSSAVSEGDIGTTGAPISGFANSQNFWPPSLLNEMKLVPKPGKLTFKTPAVKAPAQKSTENQYYLQFGFEFSFDASEGPASGVIYIQNPGVFKITGGISQ